MRHINGIRSVLFIFIMVYRLKAVTCKIKVFPANIVPWDKVFQHIGKNALLFILNLKNKKERRDFFPAL
ncbi:hypothetical protein ED312_07065 [Sinomicrobium pectinilyticum]|uniref:Uncharacterized protein n=1 Tax=Sinomicrobium pectinilyticum TaxID=1084421 RepID=A0A3N0EPZ8_SINP1|nr:hypothetical protein ED312_07065 [Sinomicrobium pectinilyticum]